MTVELAINFRGERDKEGGVVSYFSFGLENVVYYLQGFHTGA